MTDGLTAMMKTKYLRASGVQKNDKWTAVFVKFPYWNWTVSYTFWVISWRLYMSYILSPLWAHAAAFRCSSGARRLDSHLVLPAFKLLSLERGGNASDVEIIHYIWSFTRCRSLCRKILQYFPTVCSIQRTSQGTSDQQAYVSLSRNHFSTPPGQFLCLHCRHSNLCVFYIQIRAALVLTVKYGSIMVCASASFLH